MIHIWLPNPQANLRIWQETNQQWQTLENWQAINNFFATQEKPKAHKKACLYFPSLCLLQIAPNLSPSQLKTLGENGRKYLFEDISLASIDDLQIKIEPNQNLPSLAAIHASDQEQWYHAANLAGIEIVALLPDFVLLPPENTQSNNNQAIYYQDKNCQLLAFSTWHGMATGHLLLNLYQQPSIEQLWLMGDINESLLSQLDNLPKIHYHISQSIPRPLIEPNRHPLNFAMGKNNHPFSPYFKACLTVFILAISTNMIVDGLRWFYYQKATVQTQQEIQQQFAYWFPNEAFNTRLSIQKQLHGRLHNQQNHDDHLLPTLANIQMVFQQHQIIAKNLNYHNKTIELQVIAKNNEQLNQAVNDILTQGIQIKLGNVSPYESGAMAVIQIQLS